MIIATAIAIAVAVAVAVVVDILLYESFKALTGSIRSYLSILGGPVVWDGV